MNPRTVVPSPRERERSPRPMLPNGRVGEAMGEPFRVWEHPPGIVWQGVVLNHKLIPVEAATLRVAP